MADIFSIALSGLKTYQSAMNNVSNNITNVNTPNFSRRVVQISEGAYTLFGSGSEISGVNRVFDQLASLNLMNASSTLNQFNSFLLDSTRFETLLDNESSSISVGLDEVNKALQDLNSNPASVQNRQLYLQNMQLLTTRFHTLNNDVLRQHGELNSQLTDLTQQANLILQQLADLNSESTNPSLPSAASVLDQRENLLQQLSEFMSFQTLEQSDGSLTVTLSTGTPLVFGSQAATLTTSQNAEDPVKREVAVIFNNVEFEISDQVNSGKLGGILQYREEVLDESWQALGRLALGIAESVNDQHKLGMDLNGNLGLNFFEDINSAQLMANRVLPSTNNSGNLQMTVQIDDVSQLEVSDYRLLFSTATDYTLLRSSDNSTVATGTLGALPDQISVDGATINVAAGAATAGDVFTISPTRNAAGAIKLSITDPQRLAMAFPVKSSASISNTGTASISAGSVVDTTTADFATPGQLTPPVRIEFLSPTSYQLVNDTTSAVIEGPITYDPAVSNEVFPTPGSYDPGYRFTLQGDAATGDTFNIVYNTDGISDNRNGLELSGLNSRNILNDGTLSLSGAYTQLAGEVSLQVNFASISFDSAQILHQQAQARRDSISGVNLDEEAVNLMRFEKGYQASSQVIAVANNIFDILMGMLR